MPIGSDWNRRPLSHPLQKIDDRFDKLLALCGQPVFNAWRNFVKRLSFQYASLFKLLQTLC
jgi:hypothetical protein